MALSNYGELVASVADWLNREDLTALMPDIVRLAEQNINSDYRSRIGATELESTTTFASEEQQNPVNITAIIVAHQVRC